MKRWSLLAGPFALVILASAASARADVEPAGALTASGLFAREAWGGSLLVDVTAPVGIFRLGGALGVAALTSDVDARSRVLMPFGATVGLATRTDSGVWLDLRLRAGLWGGATNQGLALGAWLATGAYIGYALGPDVALGVGVEGWLVLGHGDGFVAAPGLTLMWAPPGS